MTGDTNFLSFWNFSPNHLEAVKKKVQENDYCRKGKFGLDSHMPYQVIPEKYQAELSNLFD
ncbi:hypothetical protein HY837_05365 [archaeon]|nr:hypothetical protein [archaeon]